MPDRLEIVLAPLTAPLEPAVAVLAAQDLALGGLAQRLNASSDGALLRAAAAGDFKGKAKTVIEVLGAAGLDPARLLLVGIGRPDELKEADWINLGGYICGQL